MLCTPRTLQTAGCHTPPRSTTLLLWQPKQGVVRGKTWHCCVAMWRRGCDVSSRWGRQVKSCMSRASDRPQNGWWLSITAAGLMEHRCLAFSLAPSPQVRSLAQDPRIPRICGWSKGEREIFHSSYRLKLSVNMDIKNHWSRHTVHCWTDRKPAITLSVTKWNWVLGTAYFINPKISLVYTKHELIMQTQPPHEPSPAAHSRLADLTVTSGGGEKDKVWFSLDKNPNLGYNTRLHGAVKFDQTNTLQFSS